MFVWPQNVSVISTYELHLAASKGTKQKISEQVTVGKSFLIVQAVTDISSCICNLLH